MQKAMGTTDSPFVVRLSAGVATHSIAGVNQGTAAIMLRAWSRIGHALKGHLPEEKIHQQDQGKWLADCSRNTLDPSRWRHPKGKTRRLGDCAKNTGIC